MRAWPLFVLASLIGSLLVGAEIAPRVELEIGLPKAPLYVGDHAVLALTLRLPEHAGRPVLLTPRSEGAALEVVRGRLMRGDARELSPGVLAFELPVVAHSAGTAVIRVHVLAYVCERACVAIESEAQESVHVLGR